MRGRIISAFLVLVFVCLSFAVPSIAVEGQGDVLRVGIYQMDGYFDKKGNIYSGLGIDYLNEVAKYADFEYQYVDGGFVELLNMLHENEIDLLGGVFDEKIASYDVLYSANRVGYANNYLICRADDSSLSPYDFAALNNKRIGVVGDYIGLPVLRDYANANEFSYQEVKFKNDKELRLALQRNQVDAIAPTSPLVYEQEKVVAMYLQSDLFFTADARNKGVIEKLNEADAKLRQNYPSFEEDGLDRYFSVYHQYEGKSAAFTDEELAYINSVEPIRIFTNGFNIYGIDLSEEENLYFHNLIISSLSKNTGLSFQLVYDKDTDVGVNMLLTGEVDAVFSIADDAASRVNVNITDAYYTDEYHLVLHDKASLAGDGSFAIVRGIHAEEYVASHFPNATISYYDSYKQCMEAVNKGADFACIISEDAYDVLKMLGKYDSLVVERLGIYSLPFGIGVSKLRDSVLDDILNKGIASIPAGELESMMRRSQFTMFGDLHQYDTTNIVVVLLAVMVAVLAIVAFVILVLRERRILNNHAYRIENSDQLTGERNISCFFRDGKAIMAKYKWSSFSVIQINIRNFKYINDVYSTEEGDKLLKYLAASIGGLLGENDIQARSNADNFIVLLQQNDINNILAFFNELKLVMYKHKNITYDDMLGDLYCGIFIFDEEEKISLNDAAEHAHIALRHASEKKISYAVYEDTMRINVQREVEIIKSMYDALRNGEFCFYLQPQHHLKKNDLVLSAEALVRWIKADGTVVYPNDFIPIFEQNGFIVELDRYIFEQVCIFISQHQNEEWYNNLRIAVNVSRLDLYKRDFVEFYAQTKKRYNIPDGLLELEFTESVVFEDYNTFLHALTQLKESGFTCSLDDFGAGSSSLNVLKEVPVDILKMDRMFFIGDKDNLERNNSLIASVIAMARGLNMEIIAEGIEDPEQISFLRKIGCGIIQGYVYAKPMSVKDFIEYIIENRKYSADTSLKADEELPQMADSGVLYSKYISALKYVRAMVCEIDLENDRINIVSKGDGKFYHRVSSGFYSEEIMEYCNTQVKKEDRFEFDVFSSIHNLLTNLFRGDDTIAFEYRAKVYDPELECLKENYEWHRITYSRIEVEGERNRYVNAYIENISETRGLIKQQNRLSLAVKSLHAIVYELNVRTNKLVLVQNNINTRTRTLSDGSVMEQLHFFSEKYIHENDRSLFNFALSREALLNYANETQDQAYLEFRVQNLDGDYDWQSARIMRNNDDHDVYLVLVHDISARKMIEERLNDSERRLGGLMNSLYKSVFEINFQNNEITLIKTDNEDLLENDINTYTEFRDLLTGNDRINPDHVPMLRTQLQPPYILGQFDQGNHQIVIEYQEMMGDEYRWYTITIMKEKYSSEMAIAFIMDVDEYRLERERTSFMYDQMTNTLNREGFFLNVDKIFDVERFQSTHGLFAVDIDGIDMINEEQGSLAGDMVICDVAQKIKAVLGSNDLIARVGGDEFLLLVRNISDRQAAEEFAEGLLSNIASTIDADKLDINISMSVALYPDDGFQMDEIWRKLDIALTYAKSIGYNNYEFYDDQLLSKLQESDVLFEPRDNMSIGTPVAYTHEIGFDDNLIGNILQILNESGDIGKAINIVLSYVGTYFNVSRVYIIEDSLDGKYCTNTFEWCAHGIEPQIEKLNKVSYTDLFGEHGFEEYFDENDIHTSSYLNEQNPNVKELFAGQGIFSVLQVMLRYNEKMVAFIGFDECRVNRTWTEDERKALSLIAKILSASYINRKFMRIATERQNMLETIIDNLAVWEYIVEPDTMEIVYFNQHLKSFVPDLEVGMRCYEGIFGKDAQCYNCPLIGLDIDSVGERVIKNRFHSDVTDRIFDCAITVIDWWERENKVCMFNAIDITDILAQKKV